MAQVPLLETGRAPRAPMPVLDTVSGGLRVRLDDVAADLMAPQMPTDFGQREAAGGAAIGQAIGQAGQYLAGIGEQIQRAKNIADITEAETQMDEAFAAYQDEMANNPDEASWATNWGEQLKGLETQIIGNPKLSPAARDELSNRFMRFQGQSKISIATAARKQSIMRAKDAIDLRITRGIENQDPEDIGAALSEGVAAGLFFEGEAEARRLGAEKQIERNQKIEEADAQSALFESYYASLQDAPEFVLDQITEKSGDAFTVEMDAAARGQLMRAAKGRANELRAEQIDELANMIAAGEVVSNEQLVARAGDRIEPTDLDSLSNALERKRREGPVDPEIYNRLASAVDEYEREDDPDNTQWLGLVRQILTDLPDPYSGELRQKIYGKRTRGEGPEPKVTAAHADVLRDLSKLYDDGGLFGMRYDAEGNLNVMEAQKAASAKVTWQQQMEQWSKAHPEATPDEFRVAANDALRMGQAGVQASLFAGFAPESALSAVLQQPPSNPGPDLQWQTWGEAMDNLQRAYPNGEIPADVYNLHRKSWEASTLTGDFNRRSVEALMRNITDRDKVRAALIDATGGAHPAALDVWLSVWDYMHLAL